MRTPRSKPVIGLVTCTALPEPDVDEAALLDAVAARGGCPRLLAWDDPAVDWAELDLAVLRSTWNYHRQLPRFLAWAEVAARSTTLANPLSIVRWNTHKRYLLELAAGGFPVVPTELLPRGSRASLAELRERRGFREVVLKPAVSAGSFETHRVREGEDGEALLARLLAEHDVLMQAYVGSVEGHGERSLVFIAGALSHAMRKSPRFTDGVERVTGPHPITEEERALAEALMARFGAGTLYGRVDLARDARGEPMVMELELVEPSLFLTDHPPALERFAEAILRAATRAA